MAFTFQNAGRVGALVQGGSAVAAGSTRAGLLEDNEQIAARQAQSEEAAGAYNANAVRLKGAKVEGAQISAIGANNLQQGGTPSSVVADTARQNELDALQTNNNALRRAWGFEVQGASDAEQAKLASQGGIISGVGDVIAGAAPAVRAGGF